MKKCIYYFIAGLLLCSPHLTKCAVYYSIINGVFEANGTWSSISHSGASCGCNPSCNLGGGSIVNIIHKVTSNCNPLNVSGGSILHIENGGNLIVNGSLILSGAVSQILIDYGGTLTVNGSLTASGGSQIINNGDVKVSGNISGSGGSMICGTGTVSAGGSVSPPSMICGLVTLPIELVSFRTEFSEGMMEFEWITQTEVNNDGFVVEKSIDAVDFVTLLMVKSKGSNGNSNQQIRYSAKYEQPIEDVTYYRLKQMNKNGGYWYSKVISYDRRNSENVIAYIYPNPNSGEFTVRISPTEAGSQINLKLKNSNGELVLSSSFYGANTLTSYQVIPANKLIPAIYFCFLKIGETEYKFKMVVL